MLAKVKFPRTPWNCFTIHKSRWRLSEELQWVAWHELLSERLIAVFTSWFSLPRWHGSNRAHNLHIYMCSCIMRFIICVVTKQCNVIKLQ